MELFFKKPLFDSTASPVIAYGTDNGNMVAYETASSKDDYANKMPGLEAQALENLKTVLPHIEIEDVDGSKIALVTGHEYACEKILDTAFMQSLSAKLGAASLMVGIPFKGLLIATDSNGEIRLKFSGVIKQYFDNPQQDRISEYVFLVQDGNITAMAGENIQDETDGNLNIVENSKTNNYKVEVSSKTIDELTQTVNTSFQQIMLMVMNRKVFGGQITYHLTDTIPLNDQLIQKCNSYADQIHNNEMAQTLVQALSKSRMTISFYYNGKQIAPAADSNAPSEINKAGNEKKWWQFWK